MKKLFTLCISLLFSCVAMNAQNFIFVDGDGNTIDNGATLTMDQVSYKEELDIKEDGTFEIIQTPIVPLSGVYVKNNSSGSLKCKILFNITSLPGGSFDACCAGQCSTLSSVGVLEKEGNADPGKTINISNGTEWIAKGTEGTCTVKISVQGATSMLPDSEITVNFVYSSTGINGVQNNVDNKVVARYSIDGQLLDAPQKGINILKYADGRTEKVLVK